MLDRARTSATEAPSETVTVRRGEHLTAIVRQRWSAMGGQPQALSDRQAHRWALQVAADNGLADANRIRPGQVLAVREPAALPGSAMAGSSAAGPIAGPTAGPTAGPATAPSAAAPLLDVQAAARQVDSPLMSQTLDRAVLRGFIPAPQREAVQARIESLADKHGFRPDDFARAVLMESDGFNPQANNGRCFGIIQFCGGADRGAASAGYGQRPQAILQLSVLEQLDLVDRYFDDTRLRDFRGRDGTVRLDDLYLTILTPAARQERRLMAPLSIAGTQAADLHVGRDRSQPITRASIVSGLHAVARDRLGQFNLAGWLGR